MVSGADCCKQTIAGHLFYASDLEMALQKWFQIGYWIGSLVVFHTSNGRFFVEELGGRGGGLCKISEEVTREKVMQRVKEIQGCS